MNLSLLWNKEPSTVNKQITDFNKSMEANLFHNMEPRFLVYGTWPLKDDVGFMLALTYVYNF